MNTIRAYAKAITATVVSLTTILAATQVHLGQPLEAILAAIAAGALVAAIPNMRAVS
jgi:hypothetical protein